MKRKNIFAAAVAVAAVMLAGSCKQNAAPVEEVNIDNIYQFEVMNQEGQPVSMGDYQGKVLLIVNSATECGFTPQYEEQQALYNRFKDKGLEIIDFPCNQFGGQAPGSNEEIHGFCMLNYGVTFPQMDKIDVNGDNAIALYGWLKEKAPFGGFDTTDPRGAYLDQMFRAQDSLYAENPDIKWNFTKFLIDREGNVVARFEPTDDMKKVEAAVAELTK